MPRPLLFFEMDAVVGVSMMPVAAGDISPPFTRLLRLMSDCRMTSEFFVRLILNES